LPAAVFKEGSRLRGDTSMLFLKLGLLALSSGLWCAGLVDQFHSLAATSKYLVISLAMVAIALF
jgi:hypothetical protein